MRKIRDVLRLKLDAQLSHQQIAAALDISKGVVTKYLTLAKAAKLDWIQIQQLDETTLHNRLVCLPHKASAFVQPDYGRIHQELRRKGMTLMLLWQEHVAQHAAQSETQDPNQPDQATYRYTQFCERYRRYAKSLKRSMRQTHRAGEKLFIDYAGPTILLADGGKANIFVATLGASSYTFACATARQTTADWLNATAQALRFIGGVPQLIVPDNPKALITHADRYEPIANETVHDFARHYGTSFLPARPYHPQDKGKVESAVQVVERWILMRLRHQTFTTLDEVNAAIAPLLSQLNERAFQKLPGSRASSFVQLDAPALQALPQQTWELAIYKTVRVHVDQHIEFEGHRYSVPQSLVGQVLEARITQRTVELLHKGQRVASHLRCAHKGGFTTVPEHLTAAHRAHLSWTPQRLIHWGQSIGVATAALVQRWLEARQHPEHAYRACLGLLGLAKRFGKERLEAACELALQLGVTKGSHVRAILVNGRDRLQSTTQASPSWTSPAHAHVRGAGYYQ